MQFKVRPFRERPLSNRQVARFCGQLKLLLAAGLPLVQALQIVKRLTADRRVASVIERVERGESFNESLRGFLPPLAISSLQGADRTGNLTDVLDRLSFHYEGQADLEEKIKSALVYPIFVLLLCLAVVIVLFTLILPGFKDLFLDMNMELPLVTRLVLEVGELVTRTWQFPLLAVGAGCWWIPRRRGESARWLEELVLKFPLTSRQLVSQSCRALGTLLQSGVPISQALKTTLEAANNRRFRGRLVLIKEAVERGEGLARALAGDRLFGPEVRGLVEVGESSGQLAAMLLQAADLLDRERELLIKRATALLEPLLTLGVGLIVGLVALAMILPLISMMNQLQ